MTTAGDIVRFALKKAQVIGEGEVPSAEQLNDALADLNDLIATWNSRRWMIFDLLDLSFMGDGRIIPYTVGPGGNYNVSRRPDRLEGAYLRQFTTGSQYPVDKPLRVWQAREQYMLATLKKAFVSYPSGVFLDPKWPTGDLYIYPWPTGGAQYEVHLLMKDVLPVLVTNTNVATFPSHYLPAMKFCLARRLRQANGKLAEDKELNRIARESINAVKDSNLALPDLRMPAGIDGHGGIYNIYSDGNS